jgi:hypothetical protein
VAALTKLACGGIAIVATTGAGAAGTAGATGACAAAVAGVLLFWQPEKNASPPASRSAKAMRGKTLIGFDCIATDGPQPPSFRSERSGHAAYDQTHGEKSAPGGHQNGGQRNTCVNDHWDHCK